jgi:hypothetical protein
MMHAVEQLVEALCYKPEGRRFDFYVVAFSPQFPSPASRTMALASTQPLTEMSSGNLPCTRRKSLRVQVQRTAWRNDRTAEVFSTRYAPKCCKLEQIRRIGWPGGITRPPCSWGISIQEPGPPGWGSLRWVGVCTTRTIEYLHCKLKTRPLVREGASQK